MTRIMWAAALVLLLAIGWRYRNSETIQNIRHPSKPAPAAIQFDNGTVRQPSVASAVTFTTPGKLRKCRKGKDVVYTDTVCPAGAKEEPLRDGTMTVLPAHPTGRPASQSNEPGHAAEPQEMSIREKQMQRTLGQ